MSATVHALAPTGLASTNADVAANLRELATWIEEGRYGQVQSVVAVIEAGGDVARFTTGRPIDRARAVGLLSMAIHRASCGQCAE